MANTVLSLGLKNHASGKYLTQETFGFNINANGPTLKKKQTVYLETTPDGAVHLRTHLGRYFYGTAAGDFKADAETPSAETAVTIEPQADGTWALKTSHGFYAHGTGDKLSAYTKELPADGKWVVHLAMHPQINLLNVMRKRYVALRDDSQLTTEEDVPWGADALITLHFFADHPEGRYGLIASNGKFLTASGTLVDQPTPETQFLLGFHDDQISFRDAKGNYLAPVGANGRLKVNRTTIGKDELFVVQDSEPQFIIRSHTGKHVSVRTSTEVKADQPDVTDFERFQFEHTTGGITFKTSKNTYWNLDAHSVLGATAKTKDQAFHIIWNGDRVNFIGPNGKAVTVQKNGGMKCDGSPSDENAQFVLQIINRPQLVLRGQFGFVGLKGASGRVEVCRSEGEVFDLESDDGKYYLKGSNGRYWGIDQDGVHCNSGSKVPFYIEFSEQEASKCLIKAADGNYLEGEQSGGFKPTGKGPGANTLWEF